MKLSKVALSVLVAAAAGLSGCQAMHKSADPSSADISEQKAAAPVLRGTSEPFSAD